jgi:tetratricopeptide (TPR) repeat protein
LKLEKTTEFRKAGEKYNEAIEKLDQIKNPGVDEKRSLAFYHDHRSQWFFREGDLEKARSESERAMSLFAEVSQRDGEGYAQDHLGEVHMALGYRAFCRSKSKKGMEFIENLANAKNEFKNARECFQTALVIFEDLDKKDAQAWLLHHFGETEENLGDVSFAEINRVLANKLWGEALEKYSCAIKLFESVNNWKEVLHLRAHIADVKWKLKNGNITPEVEEYRSIIASFFHKDFYKELYR